MDLYCRSPHTAKPVWITPDLRDYFVKQNGIRNFPVLFVSQNAAKGLCKVFFVGTTDARSSVSEKRYGLSPIRLPLSFS